MYRCLFDNDLRNSFTPSTHLPPSCQLCQHFLDIPPHTALNSPRCFLSRVYSVFTGPCQHLKQTSQLHILINEVSSQKRASIHLSVFLFKSLTSSLAESNPCFLFSLSLSDLLLSFFSPSLSLISVPSFTLLSLPVTSHIKPICTLLFVRFLNAGAPLFLLSHKALNALISYFL